jgi:RimJ/RimL family protein N-acetyltransferase
MHFETDRFIIRKLKNEDSEDFHDMQSKENVMRYIKSPLNYEERKVELQQFFNCKDHKGNSMVAK